MTKNRIDTRYPISLREFLMTVAWASLQVKVYRIAQEGLVFMGDLDRLTDHGNSMKLNHNIGGPTGYTTNRALRAVVLKPGYNGGVSLIVDTSTRLDQPNLEYARPEGAWTR